MHLKSKKFNEDMFGTENHTGSCLKHVYTKAAGIFSTLSCLHQFTITPIYRFLFSLSQFSSFSPSIKSFPYYRQAQGSFPPPTHTDVRASCIVLHTNEWETDTTWTGKHEVCRWTWKSIYCVNEVVQMRLTSACTKKKQKTAGNISFPRDDHAHIWK